MKQSKDEIEYIIAELWYAQSQLDELLKKLEDKYENI